MTLEGKKAPDFKVLNQDGEAVALASLKGSTVVLYFYPRANTPG
jgi:thioredoxin-dependent peroxiredoxin